MKLTSVAAIRILVLLVMVPTEVWGVLCFWRSPQFAQFVVGSLALWIVAAFILWGNWLGKREITFGEFGWLPFAIFSGLSAQRSHENRSGLFWIAITIVFVLLIVQRFAANSESTPSGNQTKAPAPGVSASINVAMKYILSALVWIGMLEWLAQFRHSPVPPWIGAAMAIPPLFCLIRIFIPGNYHPKEYEFSRPTNLRSNPPGDRL